MNATEVNGFANVFASTEPLKDVDCPATEPVGVSTYMLAFICLLPGLPGPPPPTYQNGAGSPIVLGDNVNTGPEKLACKSATPHALPKTYPPPLAGSSNTFMKPCQLAPGSTPN